MMADEKFENQVLQQLDSITKTLSLHTEELSVIKRNQFEMQSDIHELQKNQIELQKNQQKMQANLTEISNILVSPISDWISENRQRIEINEKDIKKLKKTVFN